MSEQKISRSITITAVSPVALNLTAEPMTIRELPAFSIPADATEGEVLNAAKEAYADKLEAGETIVVKAMHKTVKVASMTLEKFLQYAELSEPKATAK